VEQEVEENVDEINGIEKEVTGLLALKKKLESIHIRSIPHAKTEIRIKNKCEKGTIIKGKIAEHIVEKTVYNVQIKEKIHPKTKHAFIHIER
jgi:hypothetical protein